MPTTIEIETVEEFTNRHGGTPFVVPGDDVGLRGAAGTEYILPDGARFVSGDHGQHDYFEPSEDPVEKLEGEARYLELLVDHLDRQYQGFTNGLREQAGFYVMNAGPLPGEEELQALTELKKLLTLKTAERDEKQSEYVELRGPTHAEIAEEERRKRRAVANDFDRRLQQITERDFAAELESEIAGRTEALKVMGDAMNNACDEHEKNLALKKLHQK